METKMNDDQHRNKSFMWLWLIIVAIIFGLLGWWLGSVSKAGGTKQSTVQQTVSTTQTEKPSSAIFDACGDMGSYTTQPWFFSTLNSAFKDQTGYAISGTQGGLTGAEPGWVSEGCYSASQNLFVFVRPMGYSKASEIYRFNTVTGKLEKAAFNPNGQDFQASTQGFGAREGDIIHMEPAITGDAGACATFYYDYNYVTNTQTFLRQTAGC